MTQSPIETLQNAREPITDEQKAALKLAAQVCRESDYSATNFDGTASTVCKTVAKAILAQRQSCIDHLKSVNVLDLSLLWRSAYSNHVRSVLTMGETVVPPSIHFAASEFASGELKARLIDAIEVSA